MSLKVEIGYSSILIKSWQWWLINRKAAEFAPNQKRNYSVRFENFIFELRNQSINYNIGEQEFFSFYKELIFLFKSIELKKIHPNLFLIQMNNS